MARKKRSLKARSRDAIVNRTLDVDQDSNSRNYRARGDFMVNPDLENVRHEKPRCYSEGKTVFRVWNMLDPEAPGEALLNGRLSAVDRAGLNGMSISEPAVTVQYAGIRNDHQLANGSEGFQCSYIITRHKDHKYEGVGFWDLPYVKLRMTAHKAFENGKFSSGRAWKPEWNSLVNGKMPPLGPFKQRYFVVASLYENGANLDLTREHVSYTKANGQGVSEDYPRDGIPLGEKADDPLVVLELPISAGKSMMTMCNIEDPEWSGDEQADPAGPFVYGDPCGKFIKSKGVVKGGLLFTIYNPDVIEITKDTSWSGGGGNAQITSYECAVAKGMMGPNGKISASFSAEQVDNVFNKHVFLWRDQEDDPKDSFLLHEPSIEERCELLARAFSPVPELLEFCWMSNPEYLNFDSVAAILNNRTVSVAAPTAEVEEEDYEEEAPVAKPKPRRSKATASKKAADLAAELEDEDWDDDDYEEGEAEDDVPFDSASKETEDAPVVKYGEGSEWDEEYGDDDDEYDEDDDETESDDFDSFDDEEDNSEIEDQLNESMSKASAVARSTKRRSKRSS